MWVRGEERMGFSKAGLEEISNENRGKFHKPKDYKHNKFPGAAPFIR